MRSRVTIFLMLASIGLFAQEFEYQVLRGDNGDLKYRILYPENFDSSNSYPVLFFLHGAGERGNDNEKQLVHGSTLFMSAEFREKYPAVIVFPQCPKEDYWANVKVDRSTMPIGLNFRKGGNPTLAMQLAITLLDSIVGLNYSNDEQIYLGGLSMGGMGTFELLSRRPDSFAAAFAICGGGYPGNVEKFSKTPLWIFHGSQDNVVKPEYSTQMVLAMQKAGGEVRYTLYPDANHNSWDPAFSEKELIPWLFNHRKIK